MTKYLAIVLAFVACFFLGYRHGQSMQKGADAETALPQWKSAVSDISTAQKAAEQARHDQTAEAEKHSQELATARLQVSTTKQEVTDYVTIHPASSDCNVSDVVFNAINKGAANAHHK